MSPVAAYAQLQDGQMRITGVSFREATVRRGERKGPVSQAIELGTGLAADLRA